jgi:ABC-type iron transport system FetAB permease component
MYWIDQNTRIRTHKKILAMSIFAVLQLVISNMPSQYIHCHVTEWLQVAFELIIGFIAHLRNVIATNYNTIANLSSTHHVSSVCCLHQ